VVGRSSSAATSFISSGAGMRLIHAESQPLRHKVMDCVGIVGAFPSQNSDSRYRAIFNTITAPKTHLSLQRTVHRPRPAQLPSVGNNNIAFSEVRGLHIAMGRREMLFEAARPILLNGISRADLADRAVFLTLAEEQRRSEAELWREFELARRASWAALLDALAEGLRELPRVRLERLPRMATSRSGSRHARPRSGPLAPWHAPMKPTARPRSGMPSTPTQSPPAYASSWPSVARGRAVPPTCCGAGANRSRDDATVGSPSWPKNPARSPAASGARRHSCGRWHRHRLQS